MREWLRIKQMTKSSGEKLMGRIASLLSRVELTRGEVVLDLPSWERARFRVFLRLVSSWPSPIQAEVSVLFVHPCLV